MVIGPPPTPPPLPLHSLPPPHHHQRLPLGTVAANADVVAVVVGGGIAAVIAGEDRRRANPGPGASECWPTRSLVLPSARTDPGPGTPLGRACILLKCTGFQTALQRGSLTEAATPALFSPV